MTSHPMSRRDRNTTIMLLFVAFAAVGTNFIPDSATQASSDPETNLACLVIAGESQTKFHIDPGGEISIDASGPYEVDQFGDHRYFVGRWQRVTCRSLPRIQGTQP